VFGLLLHHGGATGHVVAVANVVHTQLYQVAATQLAVDGQVEKRQVAPASVDFSLTRIAQILLMRSGAFAQCSDLVPRRRTFEAGVCVFMMDLH
jgi:hypothetical protein